MGRPSLAAERRTEIVAATVRCLAAHGLVGTTLERIAETAGMSRGHVRHYAGNRDELLVDAARSFWLGPAEAEVGPAVSAALDYLFGELAAPGADNRAVTAFVEAARTSTEIRRIIVQAYDELTDALDRALAREHPGVPAARRRRVAGGVLSLALGNTFLLDVDPGVDRSPEARAAAEELIGTLRLPLDGR